MLFERGYESNGEAQLQFTPASRALTDDRGEYEVAGLRPGEYFVRVDGGRPVIPTVFYPGVMAADQAVPVSVPAGASIGGVDIKLRQEKLFSIRLKIQSAFTHQLLGLELLGLGISGTVTEDLGGGAYLLTKIPKGEYDLDVHFTSRNPVQRFGHRLRGVVVDKDLDLGAVNVDSQVSVSGRVTLPGGAPFPRSVDLEAIENVPFDPFGGPINGDGSFVIGNVSRGRYAVSVAGAAPDVYVRSVRYEGREILSEGLRLDRPPAGLLEVVLDRSAATITGFVRNPLGEPVAYGRVALVPEGSRRQNPELIFAAVTDENGRFSIQGVPPGSYSALAWQYTPPNAYRNEEFLAEYLKRAARVDAVGASTSEIEIRAQELVGR
jgi:hypothetical protein